MYKFEDYNPLALTVYFISLAIIIMLLHHPFVNIAAFIINVLLYLHITSDYRIENHILYILLFVVFSCLNIFFYHDGVTVLFFLNDNPMTLEALMYGFNQSLMIFSTIYLFRTFNYCFSSDKVLYVFSHFSNKLALMLSIVLRYVSLFKIQFNKIKMIYNGVQIYEQKGLFKKLKSYYVILSVMVTWALENGIVTSDSMQARAYDTGERSSYFIFKFRKEDYYLILFSLCSFCIIMIGFFCGVFNFRFYPSIQMKNNVFTYFLLCAFIILNSIGLIINSLYTLHWNIIVAQIQKTDNQEKTVYIRNMVKDINEKQANIVMYT